MSEGTPVKVVVPETSTTLLNDLASSSQHARWGEFVARYRPMMEAYLAERFPGEEAEDLIQETFVALMRIFPAYQYAPDEKGAFHNYLTGIVRKKALKELQRTKRRQSVLDGLAREVGCEIPSADVPSETDWHKAVYEIALRRYLADETIAQRTREVFRRVAVNGEKPETVGAALGLTRNAVDQIKNRGLVRLRELVHALEDVDEG